MQSITFTQDPTAALAKALTRAGIPCPTPIVADGMLHRYRTKGDDSPNCWYVLYPDGIPAGAFGCWKRGISERWCAKDTKDLSEPERAALQKRIEAALAQRGKEQDRRHRIARERALKLWEKAKPETGDHPYLVRKRVKPHGIRTVNDLLIIIPMYDTEGVLRCLQLITPKGKKQFMHGGKVSGHHFMMGRPGKTVCIAEGFATAASVREATGYPVAVAFNAGNLKPVAEALRKKFTEAQIIICGDNDQWTESNLGRTKAHEAARAINGLITIPEFKDTATKPTDFNDLAVLEGTEVVKQAIGAAQPLPCVSAETAPVAYRCFSDVKAQPIDWLWPGRIARGKVSLIAGHPGLGKSQITASMAAVVSTGRRWPVDQTQCELGSVVFLSAEDAAEDTIRPRLEAAGADLSRVYTLDAVRDRNKNGEDVLRSFNLATDLSRLGALLEELGDVALVVIDPISAYLGNADSHKNAEMRALLAPLGKLAEKYQIAIVCVSHLNKGGSSNEPLTRVTGSLAFVAASRAAYIVASDRNNPARRFFLPVKNNLSSDQTGLAFSVQSRELSNGIATSRVMWEVEPVTVSIDEVLAPDAADERSMGRQAAAERRTELQMAKEWLRDVLSDGPLPVKEVQAQAKEAGYSWRTLCRAKTLLGIKPTKKGFDDGWEWALPTKVAKVVEGNDSPTVANFEGAGHLAESVEGCTTDASETPLGASGEVSEEVASNG